MEIVQQEIIESKIYLIKGKKVMLDKDLAVLYRVETKALNRAVKRNSDRFPDDFMFQLTRDEFENLRFHFGTSRWGGQRYLPYAFTENGVAMLSSMLNSKQAIQVNIQIMRTFTRIRELPGLGKTAGVVVAWLWKVFRGRNASASLISQGLCPGVRNQEGLQPLLDEILDTLNQ